jgi:hypothetical protein
MSKIEDKIYGFYDEILFLKPTPEEIDAFVKKYDNPHGVVTFSTYDYKRGGNAYFINVHDNHGRNKHYHIDLGYVNFDYKYNNVTHLMLDKDWAKTFIDFIKKKREEIQPSNQ